MYVFGKNIYGEKIKKKRQRSISFGRRMYNTVLLCCFCQTPAVMSFVVVMVPWRLGPKKLQEGVNFLQP